MVVRLAESLELTLRERNELLLAAGFAPAFPESPLDDVALRPIREALDTILDGHLPYPAMVIRPHGLLVTANRAFELFHEDVDPALLAQPVNVFRLALHPDGVAARVRNLPEWGRHITENLRAPHIATAHTTPQGPVTADTSGTFRFRPLGRSRFQMTNFDPYRSWTWSGRAMGVLIDYEHRFEPVSPQTTRLVWIVRSRGRSGVRARLFTFVYARLIDRAWPRFKATLTPPT